MSAPRDRSRRVSTRLYLIVGLLLIALPPAGYLGANWYVTKKKWAEECFRRPVRNLEFPEREGTEWREVRSVAFSADGRRALAGGWWRDAAGSESMPKDHAELLLWDIEEGQLVRELALPEREGMRERLVYSVAISPDGRRALSGGWWEGAAGESHAELILWDLESRRPVRELALPEREGMHGRDIDSVAFSADGRRALAGGGWLDAAMVDRGELLLWDLDEGRLIREFAFPGREGMHGRWVSSVAISADGRRVLASDSWRDAAGVDHAELFLWEVASGRLVREFALPEREGASERCVDSVTFSADGKRALSGGGWYDAADLHAELLLWDLDKKRLVRDLALPEHEDVGGRWVNSVALSSDGRRALSGGRWDDAAGDHTELFLWDLAEGRLIREFALPEREGASGRWADIVREFALPGGRWTDIFSVAFSADGRHALTGGLWEDAVGEVHTELLLWELPDEIGYRLLGTRDAEDAE